MEYKITRLQDDELMHYGILGMKWGVRKQQYRSEKKFSKNQYKELYKKTHRFGKISKKTSKEDLEKYYDSRYNMTKTKAKGKSSVSKKKNVYAKELWKYGKPGSYYDKKHNYESSEFYNRIKRAHGKKYADEVLKASKKYSVVDGLNAGASIIGGEILTALILQYGNTKIWLN